MQMQNVASKEVLISIIIFQVFLTLLGLASSHVIHHKGINPAVPVPYVYNFKNFVPITYTAAGTPTNIGYVHPTFKTAQSFSGHVPVVNPFYFRTVPVTTAHRTDFPVTVGNDVPAHSISPVPIPTVKTAFTQEPNVGNFNKFVTKGKDGSYTFWYTGGPAARYETKDHTGVITGAYNYIDANNKLQTVQYVTDAFGHRVTATNLPSAVHEPVEDTPEVKAIKTATHSRTKRHVKRYQYPANTSPFHKFDTPTVRSAIPATVTNVVPIPYHFYQPTFPTVQHTFVPQSIPSTQVVPTFYSTQHSQLAAHPFVANPVYSYYVIEHDDD